MLTAATDENDHQGETLWIAAKMENVPMKLNSRIARRACQALLLPIFASLAGCGGGDEPDTRLCLLFLVIPVPCTASSPPSPPPLPLPPTSPGSGGGDSGSGGTGDSGGSGNRALFINRFAEFEPNSTLDNANNVHFPSAPLNASAAVEMTGTVKQDDDPADFFIFTPLRSDTFAVYLCEETCVEQVEGDSVYIAVYDQSQTTIASTPIGTVAKQIFTVDLTAGLAYYVEINGYNTGPDSFAYKLIVVD